ncbi:hypothetical protein [Nonomuraea sp. NPDC003709]|uniref:hypothetical protein n=1 Tax=Nonomuraea sp. NPDC003709 TaxID=3154450 RepID=UPI0033A14FD8
MISVLLYLITFGAGWLGAELVRIAQERHRLRQVVRSAVLVAGSPDMALRRWSSHVANWCTRPDCPRCRRRWGR